MSYTLNSQMISCAPTTVVERRAFISMHELLALIGITRKENCREKQGIPFPWFHFSLGWSQDYPMSQKSCGQSHLRSFSSSSSTSSPQVLPTDLIYALWIHSVSVIRATAQALSYLDYSSASLSRLPVSSLGSLQTNLCFGVRGIV